MNYEEELENAKTITHVFKLVKKLTEEKLGMRRAGIELAVAQLGEDEEILADPASNYIIINKRTIENLTATAKDKKEITSYLFTALLEAYLKTLGIEPQEAHQLARKLITTTFKINHPTHKYTKRQTTLTTQNKPTTPININPIKEPDNETPIYIT